MILRKLNKYNNKFNIKTDNKLNQVISFDLFNNYNVKKYYGNKNLDKNFNNINCKSLYYSIKHQFYTNYINGKNIFYENFSIKNLNDEFFMFKFSPKIIGDGIQRLKIEFNLLGNNIKNLLGNNIKTNYYSNYYPNYDHYKLYDKYYPYNLYDDSNNIIGNIFYEKGIIIITDSNIINSLKNEFNLNLIIEDINIQGEEDSNLIKIITPYINFEQISFDDIDVTKFKFYYKNKLNKYKKIKMNSVLSNYFFITKSDPDIILNINNITKYNKIIFIRYEDGNNFSNYAKINLIVNLKKEYLNINIL